MFIIVQLCQPMKMFLRVFIVLCFSFPVSFSSNEDLQVVKRVDPSGTLASTLILPKVTDNLELVSKSPSSITTESGEPAVSKVKSIAREKKVKRRRRRRRKRLSSKKPDNVFSRVSKFLNLFTIVKFPNEACANNGGTCFHELECLSRGGTTGEQCARGYGVCCLFQSKCGGTELSVEKIFTNANVRQKSGECALEIVKTNCTKQIRLDLLKFELDEPQSGECLTERLMITGHNKNSPVPVICGSNSGQHMYIDVDDVIGPLKVTVITNGASKSRHFKIKFTQLCDTSPLLAPKHCLQYFQDTTGVIKSFNYASRPNATGYLNNLNYAVCLKKSKDMCSVVYSNDDSDEGFDIVNVDSDGTPIVPNGEAGAEVFNCPDDYITVKSVRLCGQKINDASKEPDFTKDSPILDESSGPFVISVVTDAAVTGRGFKLFYKQNQCQN